MYMLCLPGASLPLLLVSKQWILSPKYEFSASNKMARRQNATANFETIKKAAFSLLILGAPTTPLTWLASSMSPDILPVKLSTHK